MTEPILTLMNILPRGEQGAAEIFGEVLKVPVRGTRADLTIPPR
jgi:hypothetical protein